MGLLDFDAIKAANPILDVAHKLGLSLYRQSDNDYRGISIAPGTHEHKDGLSINPIENVFYDHTGKIGGDIFNLIGYVQFGDIDEIYRAAQWIAGDNFDARTCKKILEQKEQYERDIETWHKALLDNPQVLDYLHRRRITDKTIERYKMGIRYDTKEKEPRIAAHYLDENRRPFYYITRKLEHSKSENKYKKAQQDEFLKNGIFGLDTLPKKLSERELIVITEGLFDTLSMIQEGYAVLSPISGEFNHDRVLPKVIRILKTARKVITTFDIDKNDSGQKFTNTLGRAMLDAQIRFSCVTSFGEGNKDVSDYYTAGGSFSELLSTAQNGYVFMARRMRGNCPFRELSVDERNEKLKDAKSFVRKLKAFLDDDELLEVKAALEEYYPQRQVDKFFKDMTYDEAVDAYCDDFLKDREIFHFGDVQHGTYYAYDSNGGFWYTLTNADLQAQILSFFNRKLTSDMVSKIMVRIRMLKQVEELPEFNRKPIENFKNGVLELNTGVFREHRPDDYITWQHTFRYDSKAQCPFILKTLNEIFNGNQSRMNTFLDFCAYIPYKQNTLHKALFLEGEGGNGKSVIIDLVQALFESANKRGKMESVTHVEPAKFDNPTDLILLQYSQLNCCADINTRIFNACESKIKSAITGDYVSGNYKFKDTQSFKPCCKHIFSSNEMPRFKDSSLGLERRLIFLKFENCFLDKADTHLNEKLVAELPGFFNWVYEGYKALREREKTDGLNAIRLSCDQAEFMKKLKEISNPVVNFWDEYGDDYLSRNEPIMTSEIYECFVDYCKRRNIKYQSDSDELFFTYLYRALASKGIKKPDKKYLTCEIDGKKVRKYVLIFDAMPVPEVKEPEPELKAESSEPENTTAHEVNEQKIVSEHEPDESPEHSQTDDKDGDILIRLECTA